MNRVALQNAMRVVRSSGVAGVVGLVEQLKEAEKAITTEQPRLTIATEPALGSYAQLSRKA